MSDGPITKIIEDRMRRYFAGEQVEFKGPGLTYGERFPAPTFDETLRRAIGVNEARFNRPLTDAEKEQVRALLTAPEGAFAGGRR
jgi:hypothetical protein